MNGSWISLLGGGVAAAAALTVGVHLTGLASAAVPALSPEPTTVYVEQPVVEVPAPSTGAPAALPPIVIAVLPAPTSTPAAPQAASSGGSGGSSGGAVLPPPAGGDDDDHEGDGESEHEDDEGSDD
ncbi:MAG: hypothetical protein DWI51_00525 [Chloroflexi bacterium]|nr:MAG: hypothetical protein DWI45_02130 [Chloroflexota bacterium]RLT29913.1 MAG: hypothetical protein DWI51_00525 [Chloroflexota bacterium]